MERNGKILKRNIKVRRVRYCHFALVDSVHGSYLGRVVLVSREKVKCKPGINTKVGHSEEHLTF